MGRRTHSRESIIQTLQSLAHRLQKDTLEKVDLQGVIATSNITSHFGSFGNALEASGLRRKSPGEHFANRGPKYSDAQLFQAILNLERTLGHEPGHNEFHANGTISVRPFRMRFGTWEESLAFYRKWKHENAVAEHNGTPASISESVPPPAEHAYSQGTARQLLVATTTIKAPMQFYGEPIDFRGLRHAPINEQGVVYLFGMVSRELGFYVEAIQQGFPDCEGKFLFDPKRSLWAKARIEFEFKASNFRQHGHDPNQCDFIVCWENDWPDCPINVIELRKEIMKLPSR